MATILEKAYIQAQKVIKACIHPLGIKASAFVSGYPQVWARDSMITLLGASLIKDQKVKQSLKSSLETLAKYQTELGCVPNSVNVKNKAINMRSTMDGNSWYIIGHYLYYLAYKDLAFLKKYYSSIQKSILWMRYQDSNACGLLEMQEAADWKDLFVTRGNGLYINVLFSQALSCGGKIAEICGKAEEAKFYKKLSEDMKKKINERFWLEKPKGDLESVFIESQTVKLFCPPPKVGRRKLIETEWWKYAYLEALAKLHSLPFYLSYISFHDYGDWFDAFGNLAAIIFGIADKEKSEIILNYISQAGIAIPYPIKATYPTQRPGYKDWREYYKSNNLNLPHHYHNGGIWPFLGGFYVAALVKMARFKEAEQQLIKLAEANQLGKTQQWEFNEWLHGKYGLPMGIEKQAWSAGMYIYAYNVFKKKKLIYF